MKSSITFALAATAATSFALPAAVVSSNPIPGQTSLYNSYRGKVPPYPGSETRPILATSKADPGPDDLLFQNLLSAEWIVFSFYQQGVEAFNSSSFIELGYPNTTYDRIQEIRDNEAGHLNIFQREISDASIKPGPCKYDYGFTSPIEFLALQVLIEVSSMSFLTGLVQEARTNASRAALLAIATVESRHNAWALIDIWNEDPFAGPSDTVYPSANQILDLTNQFVVNGSCPAENPPYPSPNQHLPRLDFNRTLSTGHPGSSIEFVFPAVQPSFGDYKDYYAVYFHGLYNITTAFDPKNGISTVPKAFDAGKGIILAVIASEPGAPTPDTVVAGPLVLLQQPGELTQSDG